MDSSDCSDDEREQEDIIRDFELEGEMIRNNLLPKKSAARYTSAYEAFMEWMRKNRATKLTENTLLVYMTELAETKKPPTSWSTWSMLRTSFNLKHNFDIKLFINVQVFLSRCMKGYKAEKSAVFTWDNFQDFLLSDDNVYLLMKVLLIFGIFGAMRTAEMVNLKVHEVQRIITQEESGVEDMKFVVYINDTKTDISRAFVVGGEYVKWIDKYVKARKDGTPDDRFFVRYERGECVRQVVGKNWIRGVPQKIASYLLLPKPESFTGHCYRRTAATCLANTGANLAMLQELGGWKSAAVAQGYVQDSFFSKNLIFDKMNTSKRLHAPPITAAREGSADKIPKVPNRPRKTARNVVTTKSREDLPLVPDDFHSEFVDPTTNENVSPDSSVPIPEVRMADTSTFSSQILSESVETNTEATDSGSPTKKNPLRETNDNTTEFPSKKRKYCNNNSGSSDEGNAPPNKEGDKIDLEPTTVRFLHCQITNLTVNNYAKCYHEPRGGQ
ncbi:hypothetical protein QAD02_021268 [Eretmocerus hayati]|uniref:Uncharacterized protein n=1 Tax=Eretmocerus hayati TaxID=131215 RepID=A0ACC2PPZ6_9HYME|nr:hypothetical protein QAD02_021268 [Eretmocerus hayati]